SLPLWLAAVSLVVWAFAQWPTVRIYFAPRDDVQVIAANNLTGVLVVVNRGDHAVFISHAMLFMTGRTNWTAPQFAVNDSLAAGKFLRVTEAHKAEFDTGFFVRGVKADRWGDFVNQALSDSKCFRIILFATNDPVFRDMAAAAGSSLNTLTASGFVEYRTITAPSHSRLVVPAIGAILARSTPNCEKKVTDVGGH